MATISESQLADMEQLIAESQTELLRFEENYNAISQQAMNEFLANINNGVTSAGTAASQITPAMVTAIINSDMQGNLSATARQGLQGLIDAFSGLDEQTRAAMANAVAPMLEELRNANPQLYDEMAADANSVLNAIITILQIHSPSKAVADLFKQVPAGAIEGMSEGEGTLGDKASGLGNTILNALMGVNLAGQAQAMAQSAMAGMNIALTAGSNNANKILQNMVNQLRRIFQSSNLQSIARTEGLKASQGMTQGIRSDRTER